MSTATEASNALRAIADGQVPEDIDAWSRDTLLDLSGAWAAGMSVELAEAAGRYAAYGVQGGRIPPERLAFHWATAVNALDAEDGHHRAGGVHVGSALIGALAAALPPSTPLVRLRHALVAGYETGIRAGHLYATTFSGAPYRSSGTAAAIAAAAALAASTGRDCAAAVRIAQAHAPSSELVSSRARESIGWAALTAVSAVGLVSAGFADERVELPVEAPGAEHLFERFARHDLTAGLGRRFLSAEVYVKPYTACRAAHTAIDIALALRDPHRVPARVIVRVPPSCAGLDVARPSNLSAAQFSITWLVARALQGGHNAVGVITDRHVRDPRTAALAERVVLLADPEMDAADGFPARVEVVWAEGIATSGGAASGRGDALRPLTAGERAAKARALLGAAGLPQPAIGEVIDMCRDGDVSLRDWMGALGIPRGGDA